MLQLQAAGACSSSLILHHTQGRGDLMLLTPEGKTETSLPAFRIPSKATEGAIAGTCCGAECCVYCVISPCMYRSKGLAGSLELLLETSTAWGSSQRLPTPKCEPLPYTLRAVSSPCVNSFPPGGVTAPSVPCCG